MRPPLRALPRSALLIAVAFVALGSVVQASLRRHHRPRDHPQARFEIVGRLRGSLAPGVAQPIDISVSNRIRHELWVSSLRVTLSIDPAHAAAGCSPTRDFLVRQLPTSTYPILLPARRMFTPTWPARLRSPARRRWRLRQLGVRALPSIAMVDLVQTDQDGCKGATLRLGFTATSRLHPPHVGVRAR